MLESSAVDETNYLAALAEIGRFPLTEADLSSYLGRVLTSAIRLTSADRGYTLTLKSDSPAFEVLIALDAAGNPLTTDLAPGMLQLLDPVIRSGQARRIGASDLVEAVPDGFQSALIAPLRVSGLTIGALYLDSAEPDRFAAGDLAFLEALAAQVAPAIHTILLTKKVKRVEDARGEFISLVTHQLRVPLTAMSGYADMILSGMVGPLTDRQEAFLHTMRRNVDRMNELISALGEINRIDANRRLFETTDFDLSAALEAAIIKQQADLEARNQELVVDAEIDLPSVKGDRKAIIQVFSRLLDNASRYAPEGSMIQVRLSRKNGFAYTEIIDEGIGISAADQKQLFTLFFRSDDPAVRQHVGWGLSLPLARKIIEAQGGELGYRSQFGRGSTFFFKIPLSSGTNQPG